MSDTKTRGGPLMKVPSTLVNAWVGMGNNFGSQTRWSWHCGASLYELDGYELNVNGDIATNIGDRLELSIGPGFYIKREPRQFVTALDGGPSATFDRRYVFSRLDFARISAEIRGSYAITPDLVVELYVEPFAASGEYAAFGELAEAATDRFTSYGNPGDPNGDQTLHRFEVGGAPVSIDNPDFSTRSFTSNLVLRWELLPGSTFFAVWQMNRGAFDPGRQSVAVDDWIDALGDDGEQIFALKFSYWLPID